MIIINVFRNFSVSKMSSAQIFMKNPTTKQWTLHIC